MRRTPSITASKLRQSLCPAAAPRRSDRSAIDADMIAAIAHDIKPAVAECPRSRCRAAALAVRETLALRRPEHPEHFIQRSGERIGEAFIVQRDRAERQQVSMVVDALRAERQRARIVSVSEHGGHTVGLKVSLRE